MARIVITGGSFGGLTVAFELRKLLRNASAAGSFLRAILQRYLRPSQS
jgi:hypothetical protein